MTETKQKKRGRPTDYTDELADKICQAISETEYGIRKILDERDDLPSAAAVMRWLGKHEYFREQYARAREQQAHNMAEMMIEIADDGRNDFMEKERESGTVVLADHEHIQRSKLRVDTRKWLASKLYPKKYSEKLLHADHEGGPMTVVVKKFTAEENDDDG